MSYVVALELEPGIVPVARLENVLDVLKAVAEDEIPSCFEMLTLPLELEALVAVQKVVEAEVDGSHVQGRHLRLELLGRLDALFDPHIGAATRRDIDGGIRLLLYARQKPRERFGCLIWLARFRISGMQVQYGSAGRGCLQGLLDD